MSLLNNVFKHKPFIIGMVHIGPLPGNPYFKKLEKSLEDIIEKAINDAKALEEGGVDGLIVENFNDAPYPATKADPATVASMALVVKEVIREVSIPVGVNVLRNCGIDSLAIAYVSGASYIRVNALSEVVVGPEGILSPLAYDLHRYRSLLGADNVAILADVHVKHAAPLVHRGIDLVALETIERGLADAVVVSGTYTGREARLEDVVKVRNSIPKEYPVIIGSGINADNVRKFLSVADGAIVGTYFKVDGKINVDRVKRLINIVRELRRI